MTPVSIKPDSSRDVLTYGNWGFVVAMYSEYNKMWISGFEDVFILANKEYTYTITHWCELPNKPK
jgi:hypothetical protein